MALTPGTRLGVYEILAAIGEGGMGQVFRARDTKLDRDVAIKILPEAFAHDADRLARFTREAKTLASLNHPHIAAIYGLEESGGLTALVMELVEGEDLSQRIARGAIPIDEALPIAKQIAEALEAAHEQGIIHRDLKPANIKVRPDGTVKVLDFGLAKAMDPPAGSSPNVSQSPTITTPAMTQAGMILGTAAYMAPEQARGKAVDKRADIWAFGAVLYEMLTGARAFEGEDIADTLGNVMKVEPNWARCPATTPPRVMQVMRACLQKPPKQRMDSAQGVRLALDGAFETAASPDATLPVVAAPRSVVARALPVVTALLAVALAVALWAPWRSEPPTDRPLVRLDVDLGAEVAFPPANDNGSSIAISPDGTRLVYVSGSRPTRLFTRRLDQPTATELPGTQLARRPFFSPDGQWVGFVTTNGKVSKISVEGGAVVPVGEVATFAGASWAEDGSIVVSESGQNGGLLQFPAAGGTPSIVAPKGDGESALAVPQLLPGGHAILFTAATVRAVGLAGADPNNVEVLTLADGRRRVLARGGQSPHYLPSSNGTGHLLYVNRATLFAIPFDLATLETRGTAVPVLDDVAYAAGSGTGHFDVSRTGTLIYRRARADALAMARATVQWVSPSEGDTGKTAPLRATPGVYQQPRVSPDGTRIALVIPEGLNSDVWVYDPQRDALTRLTFGGNNGSPVWSPDGQYVVFRKLNQGLFQARVDGASRPQALMASSANLVPRSFTPDGRRLAYFATTGNDRIRTVPLEDQGGQLKAGTPEPLFASTFQDQAPSFSPDGRWLAYQSNESGRDEVYVRAFPPPASGQSGKWQISNGGGTYPHWSRTGHELVYQSDDQLMTVGYTVNGASFIADKPRVWIAALGALQGISNWDLAPDGTRVAAVIQGGGEAPQQEHVVVMLQNFADELRRRVPLGQ